MPKFRVEYANGIVEIVESPLVAMEKIWEGEDSLTAERIAPNVYVFSNPRGFVAKIEPED